jgi:hypothetical protein
MATSMTNHESDQPPSSWCLDGHVARISTGAFSAEMDLRQPLPLFKGLRAGTKSLGGNLFQIVWPPGLQNKSAPLEDLYVRGRELKAVFGPAPNWPFRAQVDWRSITPESSPRTLAALDLVVSMQTDLLDAQPSVDVVSCLDVAPIGLRTQGRSRLHVMAGDAVSHPGHSDVTDCNLILIRPAAVSWSMAMMNHPDTPAELHTESSRDRMCRVVYRLFSDRLEKGVMLRACVRCVVVDRDEDVDSALPWMESLRSSAVPLSA